jgi:hypothetical protein
VTGNGDIYLTFRQFASQLGHQLSDALWYVKSTDCGQTFSAPRQITTFEPYDATDISATGDPRVGECGDFDSACQSGYTFFRRTTQVRSTADQLDPPTSGSTSSTTPASRAPRSPRAPATARWSLATCP